jgi:hypothetical protein
MKRYLPVLTLGIAGLTTLALAGPAADITWTGGRGDWGVATNWSGGLEPTSGDNVSISDEDTVEVTLAGEVCNDLTLADGVIFIWPGGALTVERLGRIGLGGIGNLGQIAGSVTMDEMEIATGGYALSGGSLEVGTAVVGTAIIGGSLTQTEGMITVSQALEINVSSMVTISGGTCRVGDTGTGGVTSNGRFASIGGFGNIQVEAYTCGSGSILAPTVTAFGLSPIIVSAEATLDGTLQVTDLGAANGTYTVLTAQSIQGTFDTVQLPSPEWSWGMDATSVWVTKGTVPVEPMTWGRLKNRY